MNIKHTSGNFTWFAFHSYKTFEHRLLFECCILICKFMHIYMQNHNGTMIKTSEDFFKKYTSHFICKVCVCEGVGDRTKTATYWPPLLWPSASISCSPGLLNRRPGGPLSAGCCSLYRILSSMGLVSKLTDFLSLLSYIIVQPPTQYLPMTGHRDVSLLLSLEWHVWLSSSGNNCHAVHRSLSSGASVYDCTAGFYLVPYCQPDSPTPMEYALPPYLEWHVWRGRRSRNYTSW